MTDQLPMNKGDQMSDLTSDEREWIADTIADVFTPYGRNFNAEDGARLLEARLSTLLRRARDEARDEALLEAGVKEAWQLARAWDEGHRTPQQLGDDNCRCDAWSSDECGCGLYGSNVVTPNPYRDATTEESK